MSNLENITNIVIPKGRNKDLATTWLEEQGVKVPEFPGRCLHRL